MKKILAYVLCLSISISMLSACGPTTPTSGEGSAVESQAVESGNTSSVEESENGETRTVVDMAGRTVTIPANPSRVAPLVGPGFEKIILLDAVDKVVITGNKMASTGWAKVVAPEYADIPYTENAMDPNIEQLVELGVEVVFYWDSYPEVIEKLEQAGIVTVVTQLGNGNPKSIDEFIEFQKEEVLLFGEVLGGDYKKRAEEWCSFFDTKVAAMREVTDGLSQEQRPNVYYVRGPEALSIHGRNSYTMWLVEMAGGNLVSRDSEKEGLYTTTMEDVVAWDPEYIFMGRVNSTDIVVQDPAFSTIRAVKENKVFVNPKGIMQWDYSSEGFMLMEFIAKTIHPDLFPDLDIKQEIKDYYLQWYGYTLSDDQAERIYSYQDPAEA